MEVAAQLPINHHIPHTAAMLPVASSFDRELRVKIVVLTSQEEHDKVVRVPCKKPAQPRKPTTAQLDRLARLEWALEMVIEARRMPLDAGVLALKKALAAQRLCLDAEKLVEYFARLCFDAEALTESFAPLFEMIRDMQDIQAHMVDLSADALNPLFKEEAGGWIELLEVPEDLRQLKGEVIELILDCVAVKAVSAWLEDLVHLEALCLEGSNDHTDESNPIGRTNGSVHALPALGDLHALTALSLKGFKIIETLHASIERLTSLKTLHSDEYEALQELPCFGSTALQALTLRSLPKLAQLPVSTSALTNLTTLKLNYLRWLTLLPPCIGQRTVLTTLSLSSLDEPEEVPFSIGGLAKLTRLDLDACAHTHLPMCLEHLTALTNLSLQGPVKLQELFASIGTLTSMRELTLGFSWEIKELPASRIGFLPALQTLSLVCLNKLTELPTSIGTLTKLTTIRLMF